MEDPIGIDIGLRDSAVLSDGTVYDSPNQYRVDILLNRIKKIERSVKRDTSHRLNIANHTRVKYDSLPKSNNQKKRERRLQKTYIQLRNLYNTHYHKISKDIASRNSKFIVIENMGVSKFGRPYTSKFKYASLSKLSRYIEYKCEKNGSIVIKADKGFKSTQTCSNCGNVQNIGTSKIYRCKCCGIVIDRDLNAALNLLDYGNRITQS